MIVRPTTQKEKAKHSNMAYVIDLGHSKQWFTEKALVELLDKMHEIVNENGLLPVVNNLLPSGIFYHKENEGTAKTFRSIDTNKWYYEQELIDMLGKEIVWNIKKGNNC